MSICTQSQVNFFRKTIDKFLTRQTATRYFCVVILHFPPELELGVRPCYNAIFTNHWDFMYVDSLGVTIDVEDDNQVLIDANPRTWIGKGFGLPINISPASVETTFSELFYQLLQQICDGMTIPPLEEHYIRFSETFYLESHNRFDFLKAVLAKFPFLLKDIFAKFGSLLTSSLLNYVVSSACGTLQKGQGGAQSLQRALAHAFLFLLAPVVSRFVRMMCANYSIEPLAAIHQDTTRQSNTRDLIAYVRSVTSLIDPPSLGDILNYNMQTQISTHFSFPPQLFMFDFVSDYLLKLAVRSQLKLAQAHTPVTPESFYASFYGVVKHDRISSVVAFINLHAPMVRMFKEDFIKRTLYMHTMTSIWLEACVIVLDGLCASRGFTDICGLFVAKKFDEAKIRFLNICFRPLLGLKMPENLKLPDQKTMANVLTPANIETLVLVMTVEILWGRLEEIKQKAENNNNQIDDSAVELMENWCHVFRALRYRLKFRRNLASILPITELVRFDLQMCTFLFALNFLVAPQQLLKYLLHKDVQRIWSTILEKSQKDATRYRGLADVLPLISTLFKVLCADNGIEYHRGRADKPEDTDKSDTSEITERKLRSSSAMITRSDSFERIERRARASSALTGSVSTGGVGLSNLPLTGLTGLSGLSRTWSPDPDGSRSARSESRGSDSALSSEYGDDTSEYGEGLDPDSEASEKAARANVKKLETNGGLFLRDILAYYLQQDKHPQKDYTKSELRFFIESVKVFFTACAGTCIVEGLERYWKTLWRSIPKLWIFWTIHGILSEKPKKWRSCILGEAAMLLAQTKKEGYTYTPQPLGHVPQSQRSGVLEDALFYFFLAKYEAKYTALKLDAVCEKYLKLDHLMEGPLIVRSLYQAALGVLALKKLAALLSSGTFAESISQLPPSIITLLLSLLGTGGEKDKEETPRKARPTSSPIYMLQLIQPGPQLLQVLQSRETLKKLGLLKWFIGENEALKSDFAKAVQSNHTLKSIVDAQTAQAKRFSSPLTSFVVFREYFTNSQSRPRAPSDAKRQLAAWNAENIEALGGNRKKLLPFFIDEQVRLCALAQLPTLIHFYTLVNEHLENKITQKEAVSMTVSQCIDKLDREGGPQVYDTVLALKHAWAEFKIAWSEISTLLADTETRSDQNDNKKPETLKDIDENTIFGTLITQAEKQAENDEIFRVINLLVQKQNQLLLKRTYYNKWNDHWLLFEENPEVIDVGQLLKDADKYEMLVTSNYNQNDFQTFILSNMTTDEEFSHSSVRFDTARIKRQILEQFVCGKYLFTTTNFRHIFRFKVDIQDAELAPVPSEVHIKPIPPVLLQHMGISPLRKFAQGLRDGPYTQPLNDYDKKLLNTYKIRGDEDILPAAELIRSIISQIMLHDPNYGKVGAQGAHGDARLDVAAEEWLHIAIKKIPPLLRNVRHMPLERIRELSLLIINEYQKKDHLFSQLPSQYAHPLSSTSQTQLKDFQTQLFPHSLTLSQNAKPLRDWLGLLGGLKGALLREAKQGKLKADRRIDSVVDHDLLDFGALTHVDLALALPSSILVSELVPYIRFLHCLCGNLLAHLIASSLRAKLASFGDTLTHKEDQPQQPLREDDPVPQPGDLLLHANERNGEKGDKADKREAQHDNANGSLSRARSYSRLRMPSFANFSAKHAFSRQPSFASDYHKSTSTSNNNNYFDSPQKVSFDFDRRSSMASPTPHQQRKISPSPSFSFASPPMATRNAILDQHSPRTNHDLRHSSGFVKPPAVTGSNAQVVVKVTYNKTVYGSREKRTNLMNMLYEKLANKIREEFVLTTDTQDIVERTSSATFDEFLRDSAITEIHLTAVPLDQVIRVRVTYEHAQWETQILNTISLATFREMVAQQYQLNATEFSLSSPSSPAHEPMPNREDQSLGAWAATLASSSSSSLSSSPQLLLLELSMDVAVRVEQRSNVIFLSEKAQSTIQTLYIKVAEWQKKPVSTFYLSNNGILLGRHASSLITSLPISTTSMVHIQVLDADTIIKIFIVYPDHKTILFGYSPDATINDIWPDLASSFPREVIFPYGTNLVESDMRAMFAKNWEKAGLSNTVLVLEVLLESETLEVFMDIDEATIPMLSRFGTLIGDIFSHFIPTDELSGYQFVGHNEDEILAHATEWTLTIYDYVEQLKSADIDVDRLTLHARRKSAYQVVIAGETYSFPYENTDTLTRDSVVAAVRTRFQLPIVTHFVCNAEGVVITDDEIAEIAKSRSYLQLATKNELRSIAINGTRLTLLRTTTPSSLTAHLHHTHALDSQFDALCTRERIMLDFAHAIAHDTDALTIVAKSALISKTVEFGSHSAVVSAVPQVELSAILKYIRNLFSISADANIELSEKDTGFALALELTFDSAEGDIVVQFV